MEPQTTVKIPKRTLELIDNFREEIARKGLDRFLINGKPVFKSWPSKAEVIETAVRFLKTKVDG